MLDAVGEAEIAGDVAGPHDVLERLDYIAGVMEARARARQQHDVPGIVLAMQKGANHALRRLDVRQPLRGRRRQVVAQRFLEVPHGAAVGGQHLAIALLADPGARLVLQAGNVEHRATQFVVGDRQAALIRLLDQDAVADRPVQRLDGQLHLLRHLGGEALAVQLAELLLELLVLALELGHRNDAAADLGRFRRVVAVGAAERGVEVRDQIDHEHGHHQPENPAQVLELVTHYVEHRTTNSLLRLVSQGHRRPRRRAAEPGTLPAQALDGPPRPDGGDGDRGRDGQPAPVARPAAERQADQQEGQGQHGELSEFDPEVERQEGRQGLLPGQAELGEHPGEPQPVQETEAEDQGHATGAALLGEQVLHRHGDDRQGDQRFDDAGGERDHAVDRQSQRQGVGEGEGGDLGQQRPPSQGQEEQAEDEENVVGTLGHDVGEAEDQIVAHHATEGARHERLVERHAGARGPTDLPVGYRFGAVLLDADRKGADGRRALEREAACPGRDLGFERPAELAGGRRLAARGPEIDRPIVEEQAERPRHLLDEARRGVFGIDPNLDPDQARSQHRLDLDHSQLVGRGGAAAAQDAAQGGGERQPAAVSRHRIPPTDATPSPDEL